MIQLTTWTARAYPTPAAAAYDFERARIAGRFVTVDCEFRTSPGIVWLGKHQRGRFLRQASEAVHREFGELCPIGGFTMSEPVPKPSAAETLEAFFKCLVHDGFAKP